MWSSERKEKSDEPLSKLSLGDPTLVSTARTYVPPIEESFYLVLRNFADVVRQVLGRDRPLFLFRGATGISACGQSAFALVGIEADQFHQGQIAKEHTRQFIHRLCDWKSDECVLEEKDASLSLILSSLPQNAFDRFMESTREHISDVLVVGGIVCFG